MLRREGWRANHKRVERLWRREGLKVPARQPKRKRLWLGDESRAEIDHGGGIVVQTVKQSIGIAKSCVNGNKKVSGAVFSSHKLRIGSGELNSRKLGCLNRTLLGNRSQNCGHTTRICFFYMSENIFALIPSTIDLSR